MVNIKNIVTTVATGLLMLGSLIVAKDSTTNIVKAETATTGSEIVRIHKVSFESKDELDKNTGSDQIGKVANPQLGIRFNIYDVTNDFTSSFAKTKSVEKTQAELNSKTWNESKLKSIANGITNKQGIFAYQVNFNKGERKALLFQQQKTDEGTAKGFVLIFPTQDQNGVNEEVIDVYAKTVVPVKEVTEKVVKHKDVTEVTTVHKKLTQTDEHAPMDKIILGAILLGISFVMFLIVRKLIKSGKEER